LAVSVAGHIGRVDSHVAAHVGKLGGAGAKERERAVNRFAAELLMPRAFVEAAVRHYGADVENLRSLFLVSRETMAIRLRELGFAR
jgi:predicted transcriptional regulator